MKKTLACTALLVASSASFAAAPGGPDCGWGNMLFDGKSGLGSHVLASLTNGTSGNASFGMTTGTNGCDANATLTYGGQSLLGAVMGEFSQDVAMGEGDALDAVAVSMGVAKEDRQHFAKTLHNNFETLFPSAEVTAQELHNSVIAVMQKDARLQQYVS